MPEEIAAALAQVAASLPRVDWPEPGEIRRTARIRRRRHAAAASFTAVLLVVAGVFVVRTVQLPELHAAQSETSGTAPACPGGLVPAKVALPNLRDIKVNVYNGTVVDNLAADVGDQLRYRGPEVLKVGDGVEYGGTARITYGPGGVGAAWVMRSLFADKAETEFDIDRRGDDIDVTVGAAFQELATPTELNQFIASLGRAQAPAGTCAVG